MVRIGACTVALCLLSLQSLGCWGQQPEAPGAAFLAMSEPLRQEPAKPESAKPGIDRIVKGREALRKADSEHTGNTSEVLQALDELVGSQIDAGVVDAGTLALVEREVRVAEATNGSRGKIFVGALGIEAEVLVALNRAADARPVAERAFEIAEKEFPGTSDASTAADELGMVCSKLGDFPCGLSAYGMELKVLRVLVGNDNADVMGALSNLGALKNRMGDVLGSIDADEEALAIAERIHSDDPHIGVIENNLGKNYIKAQKFDKAIEHLSRGVEMLARIYGPESSMVMQVHRNLADLYTRTGQFPLAWKAFEFSLANAHDQVELQAGNHALFAQSLAQGGDPQRAIEEGLAGARMSREMFVLEARTLPERQALAYDAVRPHALDTCVSVILKHPSLPADEIYQEMVRSRALVADEMARRQKNLNGSNDPQTARLLGDLNRARTELLKAENASSESANRAAEISTATSRMEKIERAVAQHSATLRNEERIDEVETEDVRHNLPPHSVLISYVKFRRRAVDTVDPASTDTPTYMAFVLHPDSEQIHFFDLGDGRALDDLVRRARAAAEAQAHGGGVGSSYNERRYRQAALAIRRRVWDPLAGEIGNTQLALVVADGSLDLIPFASLPVGQGYLAEHGPVVHTLSSERDLVPADTGAKKRGLLAIGNPSYGLGETKLANARLRGATRPCEQFNRLEFKPLPGTAAEVSDIGQTWRQWNSGEPSVLITGDDATLTRFLSEAAHSRVLHVATHAFLLEQRCGNGNPLLHSGLVFAGGHHGNPLSILTAQQIASIDLSGVDWAVLSACNTGNGEVRDSEGVLGLQRAFRVAGARSVIMTLWPIEDDVTRQFMHELYRQRLVQHASTADSMWYAERKLLQQRRAAGLSTHPWYWAGFVGSGGWE